MTPSELVETYPNSLAMVKRNIKYWKDYKKQLAPLLEELLNIGIELIYASGTPKEKKDEEVQRWHDMIYKKVHYDRDGLPILHGLYGHYSPASCDVHIKRLERLAYLYSLPKQKENTVNDDHRNTKEVSLTDADISMAKSFPMDNFIEIGASGMIRCPFHNERTASCKVYPDNHAYCYGCNKKFDVIDLVMNLKNVTFVEAVNIILGK